MECVVEDRVNTYYVNNFISRTYHHHRLGSPSYHGPIIIIIGSAALHITDPPSSSLARQPFISRTHHHHHWLDSPSYHGPIIIIIDSTALHITDLSSSSLARQPFISRTYHHHHWLGSPSYHGPIIIIIIDSAALHITDPFPLKTYCLKALTAV
jgi:hypothetical protein